VNKYKLTKEQHFFFYVSYLQKNQYVTAWLNNWVWLTISEDSRKN
jgi:hypothetical protein